MKAHFKGTAASSLWLLALFALGAGLALGCGWDGFENSVRFGYGETDLDRSRLPFLPPDVRGAKKSSETEEPERVTSKQRSAEIDKLWDDAREASAAGDLAKAQRRLKDYVARTPFSVCNDEAWYAPSDCRTRRNSALERLDALAALERGSTPAHVSAYLEARAAYDAWVTPPPHDPNEVPSLASNPPAAEQNEGRKDEDRTGGMRAWAEEVEAKLKTIESDPNLADNAAYLRAVGIYRAGQTGDALEAFEQVAARYAKSEKREAALYMAGRVALESSNSYAGDGATATSTDPCVEEGCRDEFWSRSRKNFGRLIADYPRGRFASDARGWLAYLDLRVGDRAGALVEYYRLLADASDEAGRDLAARSLRLTRGLADDAEMDAVERELEDEPRVALTYAYHSIYSYSQSYYLAVPEVAEENPYDDSNGKYWGESSRWQDEKESTLRERAQRKVLKRAADFASRMLTRSSGAGFGGAFLVRLAEAQFELGEVKPALETSRRALSTSLDADARGQALWMEGVSEYRLKDYAAARRTLSLFVKEFPRGDLTQRARVLLATVAEDAVDLSSALEQYLALGYDSDVAYFVDVLMTPEELSAFVSTHLNSPRHEELLYSLGLRFMRAGRYVEARAAFSRVHTSTDDYSRVSMEHYYAAGESPTHPKLNFHEAYPDYTYEEEDYMGTPASEDPLAARDTRVYADWLTRDMQTLADLERLRNDIDRAPTDEAKAEAMYQLASYFYEGELLFYNPSMWQGMRATLIGRLSEKVYRSPAEAQTVWRYAQEHEGAARAVALYLEVVRLYPKTRAARDSLYTAILCHQQLEEFNGYWRRMYSDGMHAGSRVVTLGDLRAAYPNYRMPTPGKWKPSTRTVNGRTAWPAPPKPKQLTGVERARVKIRRAESRVAQAWGLFGEVHGGRLRAWTVKALRWMMTGFVALFVLLVFRRTRRTRRFLYKQLARRIRRGRATRAVRAPYAPTSSYAAHVPFEWGGRARAAASDTVRGLFRLALHERGRAALALNLFTHGLLTLLIWALVWTMKG